MSSHPKQKNESPAKHCMYLRTTNPIEWTFATVRLRKYKTKGYGSRTACLRMVFKLPHCAPQHGRALNGSHLLDDVIRGVQFVDGLRKDNSWWKTRARRPRLR